MTDRSSEERSRFEKWALEEWHDCEYTNSIDTDYRDADTVKMWDAWQARAALEDRQEAAKFEETDMKEIVICDDCHWSHVVGDFHDCAARKGLREIHQHFEALGFPRKWGSEITPKSGGVPSEATPSKENEMVGSTGRIHKKTHDCETAGCRPAPAPEVQGTPTMEDAKEVRNEKCPYCLGAFGACSVCRTQVCATCGMPVQNGVTCHEGKVISEIRTAPVGTPQKETPTMPYGAGAQNFGVKTYAETADQIRAATITGTDKFVNSAVPAPEVQGTPTKSNVAHQPWCASAPRPMDVPMGRGPYPCDCGAVKVAPAPVETLRKETPTMNFNVARTPSDEKIAEIKHWMQFCDPDEDGWEASPQKETQPTGVREIRRCCLSFLTDNHTESCDMYRRGYVSNPVPEAVQGKEPQTPIFKVHHCEKCGVLCYGEQAACPICTARYEGEAAGRRSAITEIHKRAKGLEQIGSRLAVLGWCAELLEKTK